jgi:hypothetical protein
MKRRGSFLLLCVLAFAPFTAGAQASSLASSLSGPAKADYDAAKVLFVAKDYAGAEVKYASAYERSHDARLLYNMAACEKSLKHYARSLELLRRYQTEGRAVLTQADIEEADRLIETFHSFIGFVRVTVNEAGADVSVDGEVVGKSPLSKNLTLDLGEHRIDIKKGGFTPFTTKVPISGPAIIPVDATLQRELHEGVVTIHAGSDDTILLDGKEVAKGDWTAHIPSGGHMITVTAEGMRTFQSELLVEDGKSRLVTVTLDPLPKRAVPAWVLVTGGIVLTTGAAVAAAAVYRSYPTLAQKPTQGTITPGYTETSWRFP